MKPQTSSNLTDVFKFIGSFSNYIVFHEIKCLCAFTKYIAPIFIAKPKQSRKLILTPFSPFHIKCKEV